MPLLAALLLFVLFPAKPVHADTLTVRKEQLFTIFYMPRSLDQQVRWVQMKEFSGKAAKKIKYIKIVTRNKRILQASYGGNGFLKLKLKGTGKTSVKVTVSEGKKKVSYTYLFQLEKGIPFQQISVDGAEDASLIRPCTYSTWVNGKAHTIQGFILDAGYLPDDPETTIHYLLSDEWKIEQTRLKWNTHSGIRYKRGSKGVRMRDGIVLTNKEGYRQGFRVLEMKLRHISSGKTAMFILQYEK